MLQVLSSNVPPESYEVNNDTPDLSVANDRERMLNQLGRTADLCLRVVSEVIRPNAD